jgi:chaperone required for assembly of F1-ATPase
MSAGWAAKRFWKTASAVICDDGFTVHLDARPLRTPAKTPLVVPTIGLARAIADEWQAQTGKVEPSTMPFTRMANSALDKVAPQFDEVAALIAAYGASDLLCYRATEPRELIARQVIAWDPLIDWSARVLGAPLRATQGVMHIDQPAQSLAAFRARVHSHSAFELAALHDLVAITGSLVLGLGISEGYLTAESAWKLSRIDEQWQAEQWGCDEMATLSEAWRQAGLYEAGRFLQLCRSQSA